MDGHYKISYYENGADLGETAKADSLEELVDWFADSHKYHIGKKATALAKKTLAECFEFSSVNGNLESKWEIWFVA